MECNFVHKTKKVIKKLPKLQDFDMHEQKVLLVEDEITVETDCVIV